MLDLKRPLDAVNRLTRLLLFLLAGCSDGTTRPQRLTGLGVSPPVFGVLAVPTTPGPHNAVVIIPGSFGWRPGYAAIAREFADSGFVALAIDYYAETGRGASSEVEKSNWPAWQATIRNAVAWLDTLPAVSRGHIGLVGYSRGAFLAVSVAASVPVGAVVDYCGGGSDDDPAVAEIPRFPPLLILHGGADTEITVDLAHRLHDRVATHGGQVEMHIYPGAEHGFNTPWAAGYSAPDATDAWQRTIEFLRRRLGSVPG